ncbi:hypothetical protein U1Q18_012725 [Sarracenia purpurea var. burkii]
MQNETSLETTATSSDSDQWDYRCIFCLKVFKSGRALGGHQNAHRFEPREKRRTHHMRVPKQDRSAAVEQEAPPPNAAPQMNLRPPTSANAQLLPGVRPPVGGRATANAPNAAPQTNLRPPPTSANAQGHPGIRSPGDGWAGQRNAPLIQLGANGNRPQVGVAAGNGFRPPQLMAWPGTAPLATPWYNHCQSNPTAAQGGFPPQVTEWDRLVARAAGQGMGSETSTIGPNSNAWVAAANGVNDEVSEVDLELKL